MSWTTPKCLECSSLEVEFVAVSTAVPPDNFCVIWECTKCELRIFELCPLGPKDPEPGGCLNCGGQVDVRGRCRGCHVDRASLIGRVRGRCGSPPRLELIKQLREQGLLRLALNAVNLRLEELPDDPPTLVVKAKLLSAVKRPDRAVHLLRRAIARGSEDPGVGIDLGVALADSGEHEEAMRVYQAHLETEVDPFRRAITLSNVGGCLSALGYPAQGEVWHRRAVEAQPDHLGPRWNLFANLFQRREYAAALIVVDETLALSFLDRAERENLQAYRAEVLIGLRRYQDALAAIDASLASNPEELARLGARARILIRLGSHEAARACIGKILSIDPDDALARVLLRQIDGAAGRNRKN